MESIQEKLYTPKEVSERLGITPDLLRKWTDEFNVVTEWTKPDLKGHRRYTKHNVEELIAIKKRIQEQNWSWDQVRSWRNGEIDTFQPYEEKSNFEKKLDRLEEEIRLQRENMDKLIQMNQMMVEALQQSNKEKEEMKQYIASSMERRDQLLLESLQQSLDKKQEEKQKKRSGFFGFFK